MGSAVLTNGLMSQIDQARPTVNFDAQTRQAIRMGSPSPGYVQIETYFTRSFPLGAAVTDAKLYLYSGATAQAGTVTINARRIQSAVSFTKVTWNTRPTTYYAGTASASKTGPVADKTEWVIDVTAMMQSVSLGDPWYGFDLYSLNINPFLTFYDPTWSDPALRPRLEVTWSEAPAKPRGLAPAGGRAVSGAKPIVRCDYIDVSGETEMQSIQVQINSTAVFTTPAFDSGTVASSTPELDLNTTAYAGLTDGQTVFWRARVQDMAGLWSEWSDPESFKRDGKGTLTLTSPSSGTPKVEEATPPISWTFTGETQSSYQLTIEETTAAGQVKQWTTGKKTSTVTSVTLPSGVINGTTSSYKATLRVWDAKQRETVPNDPAYAEVTQVFTYTPTATVTATTSPTAATSYPYPRIVVGWQRTTDPDSFTILRNGSVLVSNLAPASVRVTGTTFTYTDRSAAPLTSYTYEVQAVVNGKASASNPTVTTTMTSVGMWLADADRTNEVLIMGREERPGTYGEASEPVEVVGASEIVLVTQSLRGLEGTITGELHSNMAGLATTAQQFRNKFLAIKAKPGRKCWLTFGDTAIQCVVRNMSVSPRPNTPLSFKVSFDFYQVGTLQYTPSL